MDLIISMLIIFEGAKGHIAKCNLTFENAVAFSFTENDAKRLLHATTLNF